ncbi:MAG: hypothetical protein ACTTH6_04300 [Candidatus Altimarinota bacterium]|nr:hypothetical protein [Candidatus Gracilibacteria bacterium]
MTPQEKIDEIHSILVKWETRERRKRIFAWIYRIIIGGFVALMIFAPHLVLEKIFQISEPIIKHMINQVIETQKEKISDISENIKQKVKTFYSGQ